MAITFLCPACISGSLTSTVNITSLEPNVLITKASFDVSGNLVLPVVKNRVTFLCSNNHTTVNEYNKVPDEIASNIQYFTG